MIEDYRKEKRQARNGKTTEKQTKGKHTKQCCCFFPECSWMLSCCIKVSGLLAFFCLWLLFVVCSLLLLLLSLLLSLLLLSLSLSSLSLLSLLLLLFNVRMRWLVLTAPLFMKFNGADPGKINGADPSHHQRFFFQRDEVFEVLNFEGRNFRNMATCQLANLGQPYAIYLSGVQW